MVSSGRVEKSYLGICFVEVSTVRGLTLVPVSESRGSSRSVVSYRLRLVRKLKIERSVVSIHQVGVVSPVRHSSCSLAFYSSLRYGCKNVPHGVVFHIHTHLLRDFSILKLPISLSIEEVWIAD